MSSKSSIATKVNSHRIWIIPRFIIYFINTNFACLENKGTHKAVEQLQNYMRIFKRNYGDFWILKCDISKFFYNIDKNILFLSL